MSDPPRPEFTAAVAACRRAGITIYMVTGGYGLTAAAIPPPQLDAGQRPGTTSSDAARIRQLEWENAELRRANAILRTASAFFAAELDRH